jgi:phage shock protein C
MTCMCGNTVGEEARFCSQCGRPVAAAQEQPRRRLERPREGRKIAGVCAGIAVYMGWDVTLVRVVALLSVFLGIGAPVIAYLVGWIAMPQAPRMLMAPTAYLPQGYAPPMGEPGATL